MRVSVAREHGRGGRAEAGDDRGTRSNETADEQAGYRKRERRETELSPLRERRVGSGVEKSHGGQENR